MKIHSVSFIDDHGMENTWIVGEFGVVEIMEHRAAGDGDKWFYDVIFDNGEVIRLFSFSQVKFTK